MSDDLNDTVKALAEGVAESIGKQIPIYKDLLQPATKEIGQGLKNLIKITLSPLSATIWGMDKLADWITNELAYKLSEVSAENILPPKLSIVGPSIDSLRFLQSEKELRNLFMNLLATSMNKERREMAHPGFVEIIKNMSTNDAIIISLILPHKPFAFCELYSQSGSNALNFLMYLYPSYIYELGFGSESDIRSIFVNLERLGLIERGGHYYSDEFYQDIFSQHPRSPGPLYNPNSKVTFTKELYNLTAFGHNFSCACVI